MRLFKSQKTRGDEMINKERKKGKKEKKKEKTGKIKSEKT